MKPTNQFKQQTALSNQSNSVLSVRSVVNFVPLCLLPSALLFAFCLFFIPTLSQAFEFDGQLKGITITDPGSGNIAPNAVITYTQDGETFTFDASGSSDPDGSITEYKWDFGDGTTGTGVTVSHQFATFEEFPVTLTAIDSQGGVALAQIQVMRELANYHLTVNLRSDDDDAIGVMFRYQDPDNYYRFSWDMQRSYRRVVKKINGQFFLLGEDTVPYVSGQTYQLEITADGANIAIEIDQSPIFSLVDPDLSSGTVAFYCWGNTGAFFDDAVVTDTQNIIIWEEDFTSVDIKSWFIVDEGTIDTPSSWQVDGSQMLWQSSNIYSGDPYLPAAFELPKLGTYIIPTF